MCAYEYKTSLRNYFSNLPEICTATQRAPCKKILYQSSTDIVAHFFELFVDLFVVFIVLDQLDDECAIGKGEELGILRLGSGLYNVHRNCF